MFDLETHERYRQLTARLKNRSTVRSAQVVAGTRSRFGNPPSCMPDRRTAAYDLILTHYGRRTTAHRGRPAGPDRGRRSLRRPVHAALRQRREHLRDSARSAWCGRGASTMWSPRSATRPNQGLPIARRGAGPGLAGGSLRSRAGDRLLALHAHILEPAMICARRIGRGPRRRSIACSRRKGDTWPRSRDQPGHDDGQHGGDRCGRQPLAGRRRSRRHVKSLEDRAGRRRSARGRHARATATPRGEIGRRPVCVGSWTTISPAACGRYCQGYPKSLVNSSGYRLQTCCDPDAFGKPLHLGPVLRRERGHAGVDHGRHGGYACPCPAMCAACSCFSIRWRRRPRPRLRFCRSGRGLRLDGPPAP